MEWKGFSERVRPRGRRPEAWAWQLLCKVLCFWGGSVKKSHRHKQGSLCLIDKLPLEEK